VSNRSLRIPNQKTRMTATTKRPPKTVSPNVSPASLQIPRADAHKDNALPFVTHHSQAAVLCATIDRLALISKTPVEIIFADIDSTKSQLKRCITVVKPKSRELSIRMAWLRGSEMKNLTIIPRRHQDRERQSYFKNYRITL
jgi:hypothetical protein